MLTKAELKEAMPPALKSAATDDLVNKLNGLATSQEEAEIFRDNMVSYTSVLLEGRFKPEDYVHAVVYVSHKLMGSTNKAAYQKTFPNRYQALVARGADDKEISAYIASYNKNKLVNLIMEQSLIPTWVLNQDVHQKAINQLAHLMTGAASEKVQVEAATALLTHLKRPETKKVEIDLSAKDNSGMTELRDMLKTMATRQAELIESGVNTREIAHQPLVDMKDVTPE